MTDDATAMKLGMYSWIKVFKRLEPNLNLELYAGSSEEREAFVLFRPSSGFEEKHLVLVSVVGVYVDKNCSIFFSRELGRCFF